MQPIQIFKPGTHTTNAGQTLSFAPGDLAAVAAAYDPSIHEAPLVIGHPKMDSPAYGWVKALEFRDNALWATVEGISPELEEAVKAGTYKKISAAFYGPSDKSNPMPGKLYLRHVGFLGATPPAVKGLQPVTFCDDGSTALVFWERAPSDRERSLFERERALERRETEAVLDRLVKETRIRPAEKEPLLRFCEVLSDSVTIEFGESEDATTMGAREMFLDFLGKRLPMVTFGEIAAPDRSPPSVTARMRNMPKGHAVMPGSEEYMARIEAYRRKYPDVPFAEAAMIVAAGEDDD